MTTSTDVMVIAPELDERLLPSVWSAILSHVDQATFVTIDPTFATLARLLLGAHVAVEVTNRSTRSVREIADDLRTTDSPSTSYGRLFRLLGDL